MITARRNQYRGVNAHLNSLLQAKGSRLRWDEFHGYYIRQMAQVFNQSLIPFGYRAIVEDSVQVRPRERRGWPEPDVSIMDRQGGRKPSDQPLLTQATLTLPVDTVVDEYDPPPFGAISIQQPDDARLYAWVELLSPSNKPGGRHASDYVGRRAELLLSLRTIYIEVDLLHTSRAVVEQIPDYTAGEPSSHAYTLSAFDVRQSVRAGEVAVAGFDVDQPIPPVDLPLAGEHRLEMSFQKAYDRTYYEAFYGVLPGDEIDYSQPVTDPESYSPADRQRIEARRQAVIAAHQRGVDLDALDAPLPLEGA